MNAYHYENDELFCENVSIERIAEKFGTPIYLYSKNTIIEKFKKYEQAFSNVPHTICYALKANANLKLLQLLASLKSGADIVSGGELFLALKAGIDPGKIVYASVGKTDDEINYGINSGICAFNVESQQELEIMNEIAQTNGKQAPVAIRLNPNIDIQGHPYISTGKSMNKFGIDIDISLDLFKKATEMPGIKIVGVHSHIGSQILNTEYFAASAKKLYQFVSDLNEAGIDIEHIDIGGGLGVNYKSIIPEMAEEQVVVPEPYELAQKVNSILEPLNCEIFFEPGRSIIAEAGALITKVLYKKETRGKKFVVVDAGMNDLIRPSLYDAYHQIVPLHQGDEGREIVDVVGPICETGDFLAKDRKIPVVKRGDYLSVMTAGAYGYSLSSNYNSRPRPIEVWVDGNTIEVIRERDKVEGFLS